MTWPWARPPFPRTFHPAQPPQPPPPPPPPPQFFAPFQQPYQPHHPYHPYPLHHVPPPFPRQNAHPLPPPPPPQPAKRSNPPPAKAQHDHSCDLSTAHDTARRLGTVLPGDSAEDIRRWVEARKKNWPSRANVQRKLELERQRAAVGVDGKKVVGALAKLADYASSDEEKQAKEGQKGKEGKNKDRKKGRRGRKRARGRRGKGSDRRGNVEKVQPARRRKPTLLRMLLNEEIVRERNVLLQAFRYLIKQRGLERGKIAGGGDG